MVKKKPAVKAPETKIEAPKSTVVAKIKNLLAPGTKCPKCDSDKIAVAEGRSNKHYCQKCQNVWVPGLEGLKREDVQLRQLRTENEDLKQALDKERKLTLALQSQVEELQKYAPVTEPMDDDAANIADAEIDPDGEQAANEDEIFS